MTTYLTVYLIALRLAKSETGASPLEVTIVWHDFWNRFSSSPHLYEQAFEFGELITRAGSMALFALKLNGDQKFRSSQLQAAEIHLKWFKSNNIMQ